MSCEFQSDIRPFVNFCKVYNFTGGTDGLSQKKRLRFEGISKLLHWKYHWFVKYGTLKCQKRQHQLYFSVHCTTQIRDHFEILYAFANEKLCKIFSVLGINSNFTVSWHLFFKISLGGSWGQSFFLIRDLDFVEHWILHLRVFSDRVLLSKCSFLDPSNMLFSS